MAAAVADTTLAPGEDSSLVGRPAVSSPDTTLTNLAATGHRGGVRGGARGWSCQHSPAGAGAPWAGVERLQPGHSDTATT